MKKSLIYHELFELLSAIEDDPHNRAQFRPDVTEMIGKMRTEGYNVPLKLGALEEALRSEEEDCLFENMPV